MKLLIGTIGLICIYPFVLSSQIKYDYQWIVGDSYYKNSGTEATIIDFNYKPAKSYYQSNSSPQTLGAIGEICEKNTGRLLFYTNGCVVFDSTHHIMENGDSINYGRTWEEYCKGEKYLNYPNGISIIAIPDNYKPDNFFILHQFKDYEKGSVYPKMLISTVNFSSMHKQGIVTEKNKVFFDQKTTKGFFSVINHKNKKDWWLIHSLDQSNKYVKFKLDSSGIHFANYQTIGDSIGKYAAQSQFSPDGKMFAWYNQEKGLQLYDFDRQTGELSNYRRLIIEYKKFPGGLCFSPNSRFIYLMHNDRVYQVDLSIQDLNKSYEVVGEYNSSNDTLSYQTFLFGMLGPDCKIYITATNGTYYFSTINNPDEKGKACDFKNLGLKLIFSKTIGAIPNIPHFRVDETYPCDKNIVNQNIIPIIYSLSVNPNPAHDNVKIKLPGKGIMSIYDFYGTSKDRKLFDQEQHFDLDVSQYINGLYVIVFEAENKIYKGEFIKQ